MEGVNTLAGGDGDDTLTAYAKPRDIVSFVVDPLTNVASDRYGSVITGFEHFVVFGSSDEDVVIVGNGNDSVDGGAGNDTLYGLGGDDVLDGVTGDDMIFGWTGNDVLYGGGGNDSVNSGDGNDLVYGGTGNDSLTNDGGQDSIYGGVGNDTLIMGDLVYGSGGSAYGGAGNDYILFTDVVGGLAHGGAGQDKVGIVWGFESTAGNVLIDMQAPGLSASSTGGLSLTLTAVESLFTILGAGNDTVLGGAFGDSIQMNGGIDLVDGGGGNDTISYDIGGANTLTGGDGFDTLIVTENGPTAVYFIVDGLDGTVDDGQLSQISGFEAYDVRGNSGNDIVATGAGNDAVYAGLGDDTVFGREGDDRLWGSRGLDSLFGGEGNDRLIGGGEADVLEGGDGNDQIVGAAGRDTLTGGAGADRFVFSYAEDNFDLITDFETGVDLVRYLGAQLGPSSPGPGRLDATEFHREFAVGTNAQFITRYVVDADETHLLYYDQGVNTSGAYALIRFDGNVILSAGDISII